MCGRVQYPAKILKFCSVKMVLTKTVRVWRKYRPRSVLVESKEVPDEALLFESNTVAVLCKQPQLDSYIPIYFMFIFGAK